MLNHLFPSRLVTLCECCVNVGPASETLVQHSYNTRCIDLHHLAGHRHHHLRYRATRGEFIRVGRGSAFTTTSLLRIAVTWLIFSRVILISKNKDCSLVIYLHVPRPVKSGTYRTREVRFTYTTHTNTVGYT